MVINPQHQTIGITNSDMQPGEQIANIFRSGSAGGMMGFYQLAIP